MVLVVLQSMIYTHYHGLSTLIQLMTVMQCFISCHKSRKVYSIALILADCGVTEKQIQRLTDILAFRHERLQITQLNLSGNKLTSDCIDDLFLRAPMAFSTLSKLNLSNNAIGDESIKYITSGLERSKCDKLVSLDSSHNCNSLTLTSVQKLACTGLLANIKWLFS